MDGTFDIVDTDDRQREERRRMRLASLSVMREVMVAEVERLGTGAAGRLPGYEQDAFDQRMKDPALSMSRLSHEICRVVMLEERLDEDAETKAKRIAEEQAERERKARAAEQERERQAWIGPLMEKKQTVRGAVGSIYLEVNPQTTEMDLNRLLDPLLDEYELDLNDDMDRAYGDVTQAVIRLCEELNIRAVREDGSADETPEAARERLVALVEATIEMVTPVNGDGAEEPVPALAQGPPG